MQLIKLKCWNNILYKNRNFKLARLQEKSIAHFRIEQEALLKTKLFFEKPKERELVAAANGARVLILLN